MGWRIRFTDEATADYHKLDGTIKKQVLAGIYKVSQAPLPSPNGYGKPLGHKQNQNLTGFFKIKYLGIGIRVVYTLALSDMVMNIIVIAERNDNECYNFAAEMYKKYGDIIFTDAFTDLK